MSSKLLGIPFDVHGGGSDLIFPHHSAEIAQSHGLGHSLLARYWVHVSPLLSDGEKMSKSLGNLVFANELLVGHEAATIRLALMHYHHRIGGEWQPALLNAAEKLLVAIRGAIAHTTLEDAEILRENVRRALDDDINTLEIIDALHDFVECSHLSMKGTKETEVHVLQTLELVGLE